jgi:hypothetical protein
VKTIPVLLFCAALTLNPAFAQQPTSTMAATPTVPSTAPAAAAPAMTADGKYILRDGDDVTLRFAQDLSSKNAADGDSVMFTLDDDLKVNGVVVAKAGSKAVGEVTNSKKAGMMGKAGELNIRLDYLKVGDTKVHLRGSKGKEGESGTTGAIVLTVLFGPIGLIKHGKDIEIKQGTPLKGFVADDVPLAPIAPQ